MIVFIFNYNYIIKVRYYRDSTAKRCLIAHPVSARAHRVLAIESVITEQEQRFAFFRSRNIGPVRNNYVNS